MADKNNGFYFDPIKHKYYLDGKLMTGTTSVLGVLAKPALIQWSANLAAAEAFVTDLLPEERIAIRSDIESAIAKHGKINAAACKDLDAKWPQFKAARCAHTAKKEAAGKHGTDTHLLVEEYINHCIDLNDGTPQGILEGPIYEFGVWAMKNVDKFLFAERVMHDPELFFAGTADFAYIGKDGKRYIGDFKTSSGIYGIDYWLQVCAYRYLAEVEGDAPYEGMTVVRISKENGEFEATSIYEYETYRDVFLGCLKIYRAQAEVDQYLVSNN